MSGSSFGKNFVVTTFGESHGAALGAIIDGCPAGIPLCEEDIQAYLNRRKPGQSKYTTPRKEGDECKILSGVFEGLTTGTPICVIVENSNQRSGDYDALKDIYRPGHADYTFAAKYGIRDHRGGGRSSGRETIGRVIAGAIAAKVLSSLNIETHAYALEIAGVRAGKVVLSECAENVFNMPDNEAAAKAQVIVDEAIKNMDSYGGMVECVVTGMPAGVGEPVFMKLDAKLSEAIMSVGAVKGVEIGDGFKVCAAKGSDNNDNFIIKDGKVSKETNHSGGILGGMSDGSDIILRAAFKPTPSIAQMQRTVNTNAENVEISVKGRHDPLIVPRAVVVVESMVNITLVDLLMENMHAKISSLTDFYNK